MEQMKNNARKDIGSGPQWHDACPPDAEGHDPVRYLPYTQHRDDFCGRIRGVHYAARRGCLRRSGVERRCPVQESRIERRIAKQRRCGGMSFDGSTFLEALAFGRTRQGFRAPGLHGSRDQA